MKAKDIEPGVVYGFRSGKYGSISPIVFLAPIDADHLYREAGRHQAKGTPAFVKARPGAKPQRARGWSDATIGYPAVKSHTDAVADLLLTATVEEFEAATSAYRRHNDEVTIEYVLVTTLAHVLGSYDEAVAAQQAERDAESERTAAEQAAKQVRRERAETHRQALADLGVTATLDQQWDPSALVLPLDEVDKLLSLLNARP